MTSLLHSLRGELLGVVLEPLEYRAWVDERRSERYRLDGIDEEAEMVADTGRVHTRELLLAALEEMSEAALASLLEIARAVKGATRPAGVPGSVFRDVIDELGPLSDDDAATMREAMHECRQVMPNEW